MGFIESQYEEAIKSGDYLYQWRLLSNEIRRLRERQRTIERAERRAEAQGVDSIIIDIALGSEFSMNKKNIARLEELREQTKKQVQAQKKGIEIPKAKTYKGVQYFQRQSARKEKEISEIPKASQRTLSAKINREKNKAVEETIKRMFFSGKFVLSNNYSSLLSLEVKYKWVFDILGFTLSDTLKAYISRNYADFGSDRAFDFFNEIIEDELNSVVPDVDVKDNKQYVDKTHTIDEYNEAINEIIRTLKSN